jgi:hypothetical protein
LLERALAACARYPVVHIKGTGAALRFGLGDLPAAHNGCAELLEEFKGFGRHEPSRSLVHVEEHLAQLCLHVGQWAEWGQQEYHQWFLFDDLWAAVHPALADGLLKYARGWDVLS